MTKLIGMAVIGLAAALVGCGRSVPDSDTTALAGGGNPRRGAQTITQYGCAGCHTIPGIRGADGLVGPPLIHIASRSYIAGVLRNSPDNLARWIQNAPGVDPMTAMPNLHLTEAQSHDVAAYLYTLK